jgi:hypothetical protein
MKTTDGTRSSSIRMKVGMEQVGCLCFAAGQKYVHVTGKMWKACAEHVEVYNDGRVILTGHVKVSSDTAGVCSSLKAERVCLQVKHGKVKKVAGDVFQVHKVAH